MPRGDAGETVAIECACYTHARRHPEVVGRLGRSVLPFQLTGGALVAGVGSFVGLVWLWWQGWWFLPPAISLVVVLVVPCLLARAAQVTSVGGRSPWLAATGAGRYVLRSRTGVVNGRAARSRGRRRRVHGRCLFGGGR